MCLAVIAYLTHPEWPLIVLANRDEFHQRPTGSAKPWPADPGLLAGQDLQASGTWLGVRNTGRFALLTNVRQPGQHRGEAPSRGQIVQGFLDQSISTSQYLESLSPLAHHYNGFNVIIDDGQSMMYASNKQTPFGQALTPGIHGLSNAFLNTPWPKTQQTVECITSLLSGSGPIDVKGLKQALRQQTVVPDGELPKTGLSLERERLLASPFIVSPDYGTRSSTLVMRHRNGDIWFEEDSFDNQGICVEEQRWHCSKSGLWRPIQTTVQAV
jgi:uncharacterized protein with NRDE domain